MSSPSANPALNFYLSALDSSFTLVKATIQDGSAVDMHPDVSAAYAHIWVDASQVRNVFQFATNAADLTDVSAEDLYFFVDATAFGDISANNKSSSSVASAPAANGSVAGILKEQIGMSYVAEATKNSARAYNNDPAGVQYAANNKGLIKDLMRDMAHQLFGTQYGVDIFQNEKDLCNNTATSLKNLFDGSAASGHGIWTALNTANNVNNGTDTSANIGFTLLKHIAKHDAGRLADLSGSTDIYVSDLSLSNAANLPGAGSNSDNSQMRKYKMPLLATDTIRFQLTCNYNADQHLIVEKASALEQRVYEMIIHLE
jgi:hypothetical protein